MALSLNPMDMVEAGLRDNFDAYIEKARFCAYDYGGRANSYGWALFVHLELVDRESKTEHLYWKAGKLEEHAPSLDGVEAINWEDDPDVEGPYYVDVRVDDQEDGTPLKNNTNFAFGVGCLVSSGFDAKKITDTLESIEGADCHWDRVSQPTRNIGGEEKKATILVPTVFHGMVEDGGTKKVKTTKTPKVAPKATSKAAPKPASTPKPAADDDFNARVAERVIEIVIENEGSIAKNKAAPLVIRTEGLCSTGPEKAAAMRLMKDQKFWDGVDGITLDGANFVMS